MRKSTRKPRPVWERWILPVALMLLTAGLVTACAWIWSSQSGAQPQAPGEAPHIMTATATQSADLEATPDLGETPAPPPAEEDEVQPETPPDPLPTAEPEVPMPYRLQMGSPSYLPAFAHTEKGCAWVGIGGQVFDAQGNGRDGLVVFLSGMLDGQPVNLPGITAPQNVFGPGGYEIFVSDHLPGPTGPLALQLFDVHGQALSEPVAVTLPSNCEQNLVLVNFQDNSPEATIMLPLVQSQH